MIKLTIIDQQDAKEFSLIESPILSDPIIAETDIVTIDNNISTYYTGSKRQYTFRFGWLSREDFIILKGFRDRQYTDMLYPSITIAGDENINVVNMTAKMTLSSQGIVDNCGTVSDVQVIFRESKQMR